MEFAIIEIWWSLRVFNLISLDQGNVFYVTPRRYKNILEII